MNNPYFLIFFALIIVLSVILFIFKQKEYHARLLLEPKYKSIIRSYYRYYQLQYILVFLSQIAVLIPVLMLGFRVSLENLFVKFGMFIAAIFFLISIFSFKFYYDQLYELPKSYKNLLLLFTIIRFLNTFFFILFILYGATLVASAFAQMQSSANM